MLRLRWVYQETNDSVQSGIAAMIEPARHSTGPIESARRMAVSTGLCRWRIAKGALHKVSDPVAGRMGFVQPRTVSNPGDRRSRCVLRLEDEGFDKTSHCDAAAAYWHFSSQHKLKVGTAGVID